MLDSLYRRPRGRRLAPVISRLTGGKGAAEPSPEERWFRDHWQAAYQVLEYVDVTGKSVADIGSGDGIIDLALTLGGRPRELVGYDVNPTPVDQLPRLPAEGQREVDDAVARADVGDGLARHVDVFEHLVGRLPVVAEPAFFRRRLAATFPPVSRLMTGASRRPRGPAVQRMSIAAKT